MLICCVFKLGFVSFILWQAAPTRKDKNALLAFCDLVQLLCDKKGCTATTTSSHKYNSKFLSRVHKTDFNLKRKTAKGERSTNTCNGWFLPANGKRKDVIMDSTCARNCRPVASWRRRPASLPSKIPTVVFMCV